MLSEPVKCCETGKIITYPLGPPVIQGETIKGDPYKPITVRRCDCLSEWCNYHNKPR